MICLRNILILALFLFDISVFGAESKVYVSEADHSELSKTDDQRADILVHLAEQHILWNIVDKVLKRAPYIMGPDGRRTDWGIKVNYKRMFDQICHIIPIDIDSVNLNMQAIISSWASKITFEARGKEAKEADVWMAILKAFEQDEGIKQQIEKLIRTPILEGLQKVRKDKYSDAVFHYQIFGVADSSNYYEDLHWRPMSPPMATHYLRSVADLFRKTAELHRDVGREGVAFSRLISEARALKIEGVMKTQVLRQWTDPAPARWDGSLAKSWPGEVHLRSKTSPVHNELAETLAKFSLPLVGMVHDYTDDKYVVYEGNEGTRKNPRAGPAQMRRVRYSFLPMQTTSELLQILEDRASWETPEACGICVIL